MRVSPAHLPRSSLESAIVRVGASEPVNLRVLGFYYEVHSTSSSTTYSSALRKHSCAAHVVQIQSFQDPNPRPYPATYPTKARRRKKGQRFKSFFFVILCFISIGFYKDHWAIQALDFLIVHRASPIHVSYLAEHSVIQRAPEF
jgi:hypothetical protein